MGVPDMFNLSGKTAVVTGASSGLGVAFAKGLVEAGADVVLMARRADRLKETQALIESLGGRAISVQGDVAIAEDASKVVDAAMSEFGRVDILVNNAGVAGAVPATREDPEEFRRILDINVTGSFLMAQACGRVMESGSAIINISSVLGVTTAGLPQSAYSASKAAVIGLTRDLAQQWTGRKGIRVVAVAPGFFQSEMTDEYPEGYLDKMMPRVLAGRIGAHEELAASVVFLSSPAAGYITGSTLMVDGGFATT